MKLLVLSLHLLNSFLYFVLPVNQSTLRWLYDMERRRRVVRCIVDLQKFDFAVKHQPGGKHNNADALSRLAHSVDNCKKQQNDAVDSSAVTLNPVINIREAQEQDCSVALLREFKLKGKSKPEIQDSNHEPYLTNMILHYDKLFLYDGILVRVPDN